MIDEAALAALAHAPTSAAAASPLGQQLVETPAFGGVSESLVGTAAPVPPMHAGPADVSTERSEPAALAVENRASDPHANQANGSAAAAPPPAPVAQPADDAGREDPEADKSEEADNDEKEDEDNEDEDEEDEEESADDDDDAQAEAPASGEDLSGLSAYERQRQANIERNKRALAALGLLDGGGKLRSTDSSPPSMM